MQKAFALTTALALTVAHASIAAAQVAAGAGDRGAQTAPGAPAPAALPEEDIADIIVTGSLIRGSSRDAALPVDVIGAQDLARRGNPSTVELIKSLNVSSGVLGDANQFVSGAAGTEGSGNVNLRGLGAARTLVLLNGRRMANSPFGQFVDTNLIPSAALARVEVLKDGAAATYGSDAIGGVVNFITDKDFKGVRVSADYKLIDGGDGDGTVSAMAGWHNDRLSIVGSVGYQRRGLLRAAKRSFAIQPFARNPIAYSASGNPGTYLGIGGSLFVDPGCNAVGVPGITETRVPVCYLNNLVYDNIVEKQDRLQAFGEVHYEVTDHIRARIEGLYAKTDVPDYRTSASYLPLTAPASPVAGRYFIPATNPGLVRLARDFPSLAGNVANGVLGIAWRPFGDGGNPLTGFQGQTGSRSYDAYRISGGLEGDLGSHTGWDVSATYMSSVARRTSLDIIGQRLQAALQGLGGANCTGTVAGANGCQYFNPFSNMIAFGNYTGGVNPNYDAALSNDPALVRWMTGAQSLRSKTTLLTIDAALNGTFDVDILGGGGVGWAVGGQYRRATLVERPGDLNNILLNPCFIPGDRSCTVQTGVLTFLGPNTPSDMRQTVKAVFGELQVPIGPAVNVQLAVRHEDYGGAIGSTTNPKVSARWKVVGPLILRGSIGTSFRGPPAIQVAPSSITSVQVVTQISAFRAVDTFGNPSLAPEKALTYNAGAIFELGGFRASLDYWGYDFDDPIALEPYQAIIDRIFPTGAAANCASPLVTRITFNGACAAANISRIRVGYVNGPKIKTNGFDANVRYALRDVVPGRVTLNVDASYVTRYDVAAFSANGVVIQQAYDGVGSLNEGRGTPLPRWKGQGYFEYELGRHVARVTLSYVGPYSDARNIFVPRVALGGATASDGQRIGGWLTTDATYSLQINDGLSLTASADNVFDLDPPFTQTALSYDPFTHNGLKRTFKLGVSARF